MGRPLKTLFKRGIVKKSVTRAITARFRRWRKLFVTPPSVTGRHGRRCRGSVPFLLKQENALAKVVSKASGTSAKRRRSVSPACRFPRKIPYRAGRIHREALLQMGRRHRDAGNLPVFKTDGSNTTEEQAGRPGCTTTAWRGLACRRAGTLRSRPACHKP